MYTTICKDLSYEHSFSYAYRNYQFTAKRLSRKIVEIDHSLKHIFKEIELSMPAMDGYFKCDLPEMGNVEQVQKLKNKIFKELQCNPLDEFCVENGEKFISYYQKLNNNPSEYKYEFKKEIYACKIYLGAYLDYQEKLEKLREN